MRFTYLLSWHAVYKGVDECRWVFDSKAHVSEKNCMYYSPLIRYLWDDINIERRLPFIFRSFDSTERIIIWWYMISIYSRLTDEVSHYSNDSSSQAILCRHRDINKR